MPRVPHPLSMCVCVIVTLVPAQLIAFVNLTGSINVSPAHPYMVFSHSQPGRTVILSRCKWARWPITLCGHQSTNYTKTPHCFSAQVKLFFLPGYWCKCLCRETSPGQLFQRSLEFQCFHLHHVYKYSMWTCVSDSMDAKLRECVCICSAS